MKRLHRPVPVRMLCLALACLAGLTACAPGGAADAEPAPIEVPPPVEQWTAPDCADSTKRAPE